MANEEPYWVRDHREHQQREADIRAKRNPPPPKSTGVVPLLRWERRIRWWPKYDWERYDTVTYGDDRSPADKGHQLREIQDTASLGEDEDGFAITSVEVLYIPSICEQYPQDCGYIIVHKQNTPEEEVLCEGGFETIEDARHAATQALAHLVERSA
jgi:hypothetical protein